RRHEVARQAFSFERDFDRLDSVRDQLCGGAEGIAAGKAPRLRLRPEGISEVFGRPVVHGDAEEMIPSADAVPALQGLPSSLQNPFPHRCERLAPDVRVISGYRRTSRENLPGCCAAVVSCAQRAHELKVQLTRLETRDPCPAALYAVIRHGSPPWSLVRLAREARSTALATEGGQHGSPARAGARSILPTTSSKRRLRLKLL